MKFIICYLLISVAPVFARVNEGAFCLSKNQIFYNSVDVFITPLFDIAKSSSTSNESRENVINYLISNEKLVDSFVNRVIPTIEVSELESLEPALAYSISKNSILELCKEEVEICNEKASKHLEKAVEDYLWGSTEMALGVIEILRGDPIGGALAIGDGIRNYREAWDELKEAIAENNKEEE